MLGAENVLLLTGASGIIGVTWYYCWWLSKQFSDVRRLVHSGKEEVKVYFSDKLDYHEKHDDDRFAKIMDEIWLIKLRNAAIDAERNLKSIKKEKSDLSVDKT